MNLMLHREDEKEVYIAKTQIDHILNSFDIRNRALIWIKIIISDKFMNNWYFYNFNKYNYIKKWL